MKTLKLLVKTSLFNTINDFLCLDIIKYIFNRRSNRVFISYIIKIKTLNQDVLMTNAVYLAILNHGEIDMYSVCSHLQYVK